jgi:hypothetical protein
LFVCLFVVTLWLCCVVVWQVACGGADHSSRLGSGPPLSSDHL